MDYTTINQKLWNNKTDIHYTSDFYDVESFIKGKDSLNSIEKDLLGDVKGKKILHLQCHFGMDSLSLARHGAKVTGVDFSEKAILQARQLNKTLGTDARFIQSDIYQLDKVLDEKFDIVFTSYGVIGWLPDMNKWSKIIHRFLKPKGRFVMVEFHPVVWMFSYDFKEIAFNYFNAAPIIEELEGTYAQKDSAIKDQSVCWNHGLAEVIDSLIQNGLQLTSFKEYNYSPYDCFENTIQPNEGIFQIKHLGDKIPMTYSITAVKEDN